VEETGGKQERKGAANKGTRGIQRGRRDRRDILLISPLAVVEDIKQLIQIQTGYQSSIR